MAFMRGISFPDCSVIDVQFHPAKKTMQICVDGAWFVNDTSDGKKLGKGKLFFRSWKNLEIHQYNHTSNSWIEINFNEFEPIKDICEFQYVDGSIRIRGFGKRSGLWIEYKIDFPIIEFEFDEIND